MITNQQQRDILMYLHQPVRAVHIAIAASILFIPLTAFSCESKPPELPKGTPIKDCPKAQIKTWPDGKKSCITSGLRG